MIRQARLFAAVAVAVAAIGCEHEPMSTTKPTTAISNLTAPSSTEPLVIPPMPTSAPTSAPTTTAATPTLSTRPSTQPLVAIEETPAEHDQKMKWWREARFGMFIHWGLYATYAGSYHGTPTRGAGEWIQTGLKIPVADYAANQSQFNPTKFNADEWVTLAKRAGMKYIVITAKHHEGFAMYHTAVDNFNIYDGTPFHRDPLKELSEACAKQGIRFGVYYSQAQDWHHTGGSGAAWDHSHDGNMDDYLDKVAVPQVRELLTQYGPIAELWWDTAYGMNPARAAKFFDDVKLQPMVVTNNRLGGGVAGDLNTPEQHIPPTGFPGRDWETCMTINDTWGFKTQDTNFKSDKTLLHNLCDIASKGGNYLLNVGPTAEGIIPQPEVDRLEAMGKWLDVNGEAIYGSSAGPFPRQLAFGRATQKPGKLYLEVFDWPSDGSLIVPIRNTITRASLLADPKADVSFESTPDGVKLKLPTAAPDPIASVIALDVPDPIQPLPTPVPQDEEKGLIQLDAATADVSGDAKLIVPPGSKAASYVGNWKSDDATVSWPVLIRKPGTFAVSVSAKAKSATTLVLDVDGKTLNIKVPASSDFKTIKAETLTLDQPGVVTFRVTDASAAASGVNLSWIALKPQ